MKKNNLKEVIKLCSINSPYENFSHSEKPFVKAMKEICEWHREHSDFYKKLLEVESINLDEIETVEDCLKIPHLWAHFFKTHELLSVPTADVYLHLTSSGTSGQKSQIFFDERTIKSAQSMVDGIFEYYGWITPKQKCNYVLFSYETESSSKLGTSYTDNFLCKYAPINEVFYALKLSGNGGHEFDPFGTIKSFQNYESQSLPVRIFGFPAFLYFSLIRMKNLNIPPVKLHPESLVFLGGGWKGYADKQIEKYELYALIEEMLGIPNHRLRDGFGSVEHCIPYIECNKHEFHIPIWSRVFIRDVDNLDNLGFGQPGFLQFISPYITSMPAHSIIMGDIATLYDGESCSCELKTPYFRINSRAGTSKNKSCALTASKLLKGKSL
jgi:phenylacetate-coenzyme A ligase PaaK-like adenylate-forming protein